MALALTNRGALPFCDMFALLAAVSPTELLGCCGGWILVAGGADFLLIWFKTKLRQWLNSPVHCRVPREPSASINGHYEFQREVWGTWKYCHTGRWHGPTGLPRMLLAFLALRLASHSVIKRAMCFSCSQACKVGMCLWSSVLHGTAQMRKPIPSILNLHVCLSYVCTSSRKDASHLQAPY